MIKELTLENWKSFDKATLYIDPLTVLIGLNASGKSNVLDALQFLQRSITSRDIYSAIVGDRDNQGVRGGIENIALRGQNTPPTLSIIVESEGDGAEYKYTLSIQPKFLSNSWQEATVYKESLIKTTSTIDFNVFEATNISSPPQMLKVSIARPHIKSPENYHQAGTKRATQATLSAKETVLKQLGHRTDLPPQVAKSVSIIVQALENIFILDSIPATMRSYSKVSPYLATDGSNAAGVIAALSDSQKKMAEDILTQYAKQLPEQELQKIWVEVVGLGNDAMFYCQENFIKNDTNRIDAQSLSDGTLRFLAVLTAILTRPKGSLLLVEEIDNGIHPSRAKLLLTILHKEGTKRQVDILTTTHNAAFLNELTPAYLPFIMYVHRNKQSGCSEITPIDELENLPFLLGQGRLGNIIANSKLEYAIG